jgi:hypothetical protein
MDTDAKWLIVCAVVFFVSCSALLVTIPDDTEPIAVTRQSGFVIEVDNELMKSACRYHNIGSNGIIWDTVNDNFVFYRDGQKCFVFTNGFKEYLSKNLTDVSPGLHLSSD